MANAMIWIVVGTTLFVFGTIFAAFPLRAEADDRSQSFWGILWFRFRKDKVFVIGVLFIAAGGLTATSGWNEWSQVGQKREIAQALATEISVNLLTFEAHVKADQNEDALDGWYALSSNPAILTDGEFDGDKLAQAREIYMRDLRNNDSVLAEFVLRNTNLRQMPQNVQTAFKVSRSEAARRTIGRITASESARTRHLRSIGATR